MSSRQLLFTTFYRLGFTPWDGHPLAQTLKDLVEGDAALPAGTALDLGCGTGDTSIYLAKHGWQVTGVDFVAKALDKARAKAAADKVNIDFAQANVIQLSSEGVGSNFRFIIDNGCLHGMSQDDRNAYVREVTAVAAPDARLLLVEFVPGERFGVPGIEPAEVERRFAEGWTLLSSGEEPVAVRDGRNVPRYYLFDRAS
ncbi:MAG TPA: methyltransferase domain-containing protein [Mycobacterium sp.]|nr:methyltransferase domain-containing protein [Mycobacterium sp.]